MLWSRWRDVPWAVASPRSVLPVLHAERRELVGVAVGDHRLWIDPGVRAQRPADRLADEELAVAAVGLDALGQQREVGLGLRRTWAMIDARRFHMSGVDRPVRNDRRDVWERPARGPQRHSVDEVPPGAGDDQLLVQRERAPWVAVGGVAPVLRAARAPCSALRESAAVAPQRHGSTRPPRCTGVEDLERMREAGCASARRASGRRRTASSDFMYACMSGCLGRVGTARRPRSNRVDHRRSIRSRT